MTLLLKCKSVPETKKFYSDKLGFEVRDSSEGTCTVQNGEAKLIFTAGDLWKGAPSCTGTIYLHPLDVDACYAAIKDKVKVRWPLQDMPYGTREFGIEDCNGYTLAFAN